MLEHVSPEAALFYRATRTPIAQGRVRMVKSSMVLQIHQSRGTTTQPKSSIEWLTEKSCLQLTRSRFTGRRDIEMLTGIAVGHLTQQRLVHRQTFELPQSKTTARQRGQHRWGRSGREISKTPESAWLQGKCLGGIYYGGFFQDNFYFNWLC